MFLVSPPEVVAQGREFESPLRVVVLVNQMLCIGHHLSSLHLGGAVVTDYLPMVGVSPKGCPRELGSFNGWYLLNVLWRLGAPLPRGVLQL